MVSSVGLWVSLSGASGATSSATTTKTFNFTGDEQLFTVPDGVTSISVTAVGGKGAPGSSVVAPGGLGAVANADLGVTPGQVLFVEVGNNGGVNGNAFNGGGAGGLGSGNHGGGGGGATDVRTIARNSASGPTVSAGSRLVTAGGGGGGGGRNVAGTSLAGGGGSAGVQPFGNGSSGSGAYTFGGGSGASGSGGFGGGPGSPPSPGVGGDGAATSTGINGGSGGGAGGGRGGGTGGGAAEADDTGGGGGGGGGSAFASTATQSSIQGDTTGVPQLRITYKVAEGGANKSGLKFGKVKLNKDKGTATLPVTVPGSGTLSIGGKGVVKKRPGLARALGALQKKIAQAGTYKLKVKTKGPKKAKLFDIGKVKVKAVVTFKPTSGDSVKDTRKITLKKS